MNLKINDSYYISDITPNDRAAYLEHLKEKQIYLQTFNIPYPYTEADADWWINHNLELAKKHGGRTTDGAIRRSHDNYLVGSVGFHGFEVGKSHKAELGYWLSRPLWGKGIMTEAVKKVTEYAFNEFGLTRITAHVFEFNKGSARVLEKVGYICEGILRGHYKKDGKIFDGKIYALLKDDWQKASDKTSRPDFIKHYSEIQEDDCSHYPNSSELHSIGSPFAKKFGLKKLGIHHEVLPPGRRTSYPHAESDEEEFVYVIEGHPDAWVDGKMYGLKPGDAVGFPPGTGICHTFINNTESTVRLLVVGEATKKENKCFYALNPEQNLKLQERGILWENPPRAKLGEHDGLPDKLREKL